MRRESLLFLARARGGVAVVERTWMDLMDIDDKDDKQVQV